MTSIYNFYEAVEALSLECNDSLIEYTYCKTLLESTYNYDYKHDGEFTELELRQLAMSPHVHPDLVRRELRYEKAFNIRNSIRYIEVIKQKCISWELQSMKMLFEIVNDISNENQNILDVIQANKKVLGEVQELTGTNNKVLTEVKKSNKNSTFLGWLSVSIAVFSLGGLYPDNYIFKWVCFAIAVLVFASYLIKTYLIQTREEKKDTKENCRTQTSGTDS